jgi:hypothetical protein
MTATAPTVEPGEVDKINVGDLKSQGEGEMHVMHKDYTIRVKSFISGGWKSDEEYEAWREKEDKAEVRSEAAVEARKRNSIIGRLKAALSKFF